MVPICFMHLIDIQRGLAHQKTGMRRQTRISRKNCYIIIDGRWIDGLLQEARKNSDLKRTKFYKGLLKTVRKDAVMLRTTLMIFPIKHLKSFIRI